MRSWRIDGAVSKVMSLQSVIPALSLGVLLPGAFLYSSAEQMRIGSSDLELRIRT